jgi:hypothetical protein
VTVPLTIADAPADGSLFGQVIPWLVALLGVVVVGGVGIWIIRRTLKQDSGGGVGGFTLQDLRGMKASGELSDEEFERARDAIIGRLSEPVATEHEPEDTNGS